MTQNWKEFNPFPDYGEERYLAPAPYALVDALLGELLLRWLGAPEGNPRAARRTLTSASCEYTLAGIGAIYLRTTEDPDQTLVVLGTQHTDDALQLFLSVQFLKYLLDGLRFRLDLLGERTPSYQPKPLDALAGAELPDAPVRARKRGNVRADEDQRVIDRLSAGDDEDEVRREWAAALKRRRRALSDENQAFRRLKSLAKR